MKRLVIYLDGTWNQPQAETNVHRLFEITADQDGAGIVQQKKYLKGVGTTWLEWLRGGVFGFGTGSNIRAAYEWLKDGYEDGDEIFVLGFSRGAYSARSLAGMISRCGLLRPDATTSVDEIYQRYAVRNEELVADSRHVPIHFVGVWDTVGALGVPFGNFPGVSRSTTLFHNTSPSPRYRNMFQALAVDEHRAAFAPTLWTDEDGFALSPEQRIEQRWFAGAHSDVGGGGGRDDGLPRIALAWMWARAGDCGLAFTRTVTEGPDDHRAPITNSFARFLFGTYRIARLNRPFYRPVRRPEITTAAGKTVHPLNETFDPSVSRRWQEDRTYRREAKNLAGAFSGSTASQHR
jgi:uncharacterized protein (DUF2235 family)